MQFWIIIILRLVRGWLGFFPYPLGQPKRILNIISGDPMNQPQRLSSARETPFLQVERCMAKENINYLPIKEIRGICCSRQGSRINYSLGEKHKEMDSSACLGSHRIIGQGDDVKADILLANILLAEVSPTLTRHKGNPWVIRCKLWLTIRRWTYSNAIPSLCGILEKLYSLSNER